MDFKDSRFQARIRITQDDLDWIKENKGQKSAAGFLESVLEEYRKPNLFKKRK